MLSLRTQITALFSFTLILLLVSTACAQNLQSVKSRMLDRKPAIDTLKGQGLIGEGSDGYLHMRQANAGAQNVLNAENADRRTVYAAIAKSQGANVATVASRRALQLAEIASPGHWLQKPDGSWYKK